MGGFKDLFTEGHALVAQLDEKQHELATAFRDWFDRLTHNLPALEAEAEADAGQIARDAATAAAPVVAESEHDAEKVAEHVVADVETAAAPAAAPETPTA